MPQVNETRLAKDGGPQKFEVKKKNNNLANAGFSGAPPMDGNPDVGVEEQNEARDGGSSQTYTVKKNNNYVNAGLP